MNPHRRVGKEVADEIAWEGALVGVEGSASTVAQPFVRPD
jgi:hypothetical protein